MNWTEGIFFGVFMIFVLIMLVIDLGMFSRKDHVLKFKEAFIWSMVWISLGVGFYFFVHYFGHLIHGIRDAGDIELYIQKFQPYWDKEVSTIAEFNRILAIEYLTGYLIEKTLSVDNIFVIMMIFLAFGVPEKLYKRVLLWGILGALVMRFIFIFAGAALVIRFDWILILFGLFLVYAGIALALEKRDHHKVKVNKHPVVKFLSRYFAVHDRFVGNQFFTKINGKKLITPLFVVLLIIEFSDLIFAFDSIPAIFSVTKDPYIIFFSNVFAILGLRALFFLLSSIIHYFKYLKLSVAILLVLIGIKLLLEKILSLLNIKAFHFKPVYFLLVVLVILSIGVFASLIAIRKNPSKITKDS